MSERIMHFLLLTRVWLIIKFKKLKSKFHHHSPNFTRFVIVCEGRTGSTLLHTYLNSHQQVLSYGDILNRIEVNEESLNTRIYCNHPSNLKAVGFKLFYGDHQYTNRNTLFQQIIDDKNIRIIHLKRKNSMKMFVSLKLAERSGEWTKGSARSNSHQELLEIEIEELNQFIESYEQNKELFNQMFTQHSVLEVNYEELVDKPKGCLGEIQKFLQVPEINLISALQKQNDKPLDQLISNYDTIKKAFPGKYLD